MLLCAASDSEAVREPSETLVVEDELSGVRLLDYLERRWPDADRSALRGLVRDGCVSVNGGDAHGGSKLRAGDVVMVVTSEGEPRRHRGDRGEPTASDLPVLAEADFALVVDKPAGLPCVPDRYGRTKGVHGLLAELRPDDDLRIAHRTDRFTSGCLVIAKGVEGARWLDLCFREGSVSKEYLAVVEGVMHQDQVEVKRALGPDSRRLGKVVVVSRDHKGAREAVTLVEVVERFRRHTLVRAIPKTGRGHQIRVHLASLHHPIVADVDYGASGPLLLSQLKSGYKTRRGVTEPPLLARMFLHASRVAVPAPDGVESLRAEAGLPADLDLALTKLRRFAR